MSYSSKKKEQKAKIQKIRLVGLALGALVLGIAYLFGQPSEEDMPPKNDQSMAAEGSLDYALNNIKFPFLETADSYKYKHCLARYIPQYPDYKFSAVNRIDDNHIRIEIPLETIQPAKFNVLKEAGYGKPFIYNVGIQADRYSKEHIVYNFSITSEFAQSGPYRRSTKTFVKETQSVSVKRNTTNGIWGTVSTGTNNRLLSKYDDFNAKQEEAINLMYFYSMNIMRGIAGNISECYFHKSLADNVIKSVEAMPDRLKGKNSFTPSSSE